MNYNSAESASTDMETVETFLQKTFQIDQGA